MQQKSFQLAIYVTSWSKNTCNGVFDLYFDLLQLFGNQRACLPIWVKIPILPDPGADKRKKCQALFLWDFNHGSGRRGKSLDVIYLQLIIDFPLKISLPLLHLTSRFAIIWKCYFTSVKLHLLKSELSPYR